MRNGKRFRLVECSLRAFAFLYHSSVRIYQCHYIFLYYLRYSSEISDFISIRLDLLHVTTSWFRNSFHEQRFADTKLQAFIVRSQLYDIWAMRIICIKSWILTLFMHRYSVSRRFLGESFNTCTNSLTKFSVIVVRFVVLSHFSNVLHKIEYGTLSNAWFSVYGGCYISLL